MRGPAERDKLIWGWLRLALGMAQIVLSTAALVLLSAVGLQSITWVSSWAPPPQWWSAAFFITEGPAPD